LAVNSDISIRGEFVDSFIIKNLVPITQNTIELLERGFIIAANGRVPRGPI